MGIAVFSPPLDHHGNSVRGIAFCKELLTRHPLGIFQSIVVQSKLSLFDAGAHSVAGETLSFLCVRLCGVGVMVICRVIVVSLYRCIVVSMYRQRFQFDGTAVTSYECCSHGALTWAPWW
jgi:hypothetical protein